MGASTVARLRCLRGIDTLSAVGLCAEIGDFDRFERAGQLMSYLGLVPVREQLRRDAPAGRDHQDRLAPRPPAARRGGLALPRARARGHALKRRQDGQPAHVLAIAWQAQRRLHRIWRRLDGERGKRRTIVAVAVARELAGFCWAIANAD